MNDSVFRFLLTFAFVLVTYDVLPVLSHASSADAAAEDSLDSGSLRDLIEEPQLWSEDDMESTAAKRSAILRNIDEKVANLLLPASEYYVGLRRVK